MFSYSVKDVSFSLLDPDESTLRETLPGNSYEPAVVAILHKVFTKYQKGTFLDIGALYGYFSCFVSKLASEVTVVAFEPSERSAALAEKNFAINGMRSARIERVALTSSSRVQQFVGKTLVREGVVPGLEVTHQSPHHNYDNVSVAKCGTSRVGAASWLLSSVKHGVRLLKGWNKKESVKCIPFEGNFDHLNVRPVVAKIDVHGAEISVLKGMERYLTETVDVLLLEMHRDDMLVEGSHKDTIKILKGSGLDLFEIVDFRSDTKWKLQSLTEGALDTLTSSKYWSFKDRAVMRMVLGIRKESIDVDFH